MQASGSTQVVESQPRPGLYETSKDGEPLCSSVEGPVNYFILKNHQSTVLLFGDVHMIISPEASHGEREEEPPIQIGHLVWEARRIKGLALTILTEAHTTNVRDENVRQYMQQYLKVAYCQGDPRYTIDKYAQPPICVDARFLHKTGYTGVLEPRFHLEGLVSDVFDIVDKYGDVIGKCRPFSENSDVCRIAKTYKQADFKYLLSAFNSIFPYGPRSLKFIQAPSIPKGCTPSILLTLLDKLNRDTGVKQKARWAKRVDTILGAGPPLLAIKCIRGLLAWLCARKEKSSWTDFEGGIQNNEVRSYLFEGYRWELLWGCMLDFHASATILALPTNAGPQLVIGYLGARHLSHISDLLNELRGYAVTESHPDYDLSNLTRRITFQNRVNLFPGEAYCNTQTCPRCFKIRQPRKKLLRRTGPASEK
jgi:hypothetical protein